MSFEDFFAELRRRRVIRVALVYAVVGWVLIEVASVVFPVLAMPEWSVRLVVLLTMFGFPIAVVLAWALEVTPEGIRRTPPAEGGTALAGGEAAGDAAATGRVGPSGTPARRSLAIGAVAVAALAVAGYLAAGSSRSAVDPADPVGSEARPDAAASIAVLPFQNIGGDPENEYFSDGITEDIIAQLTRVPDLTVISRTSAMRYRDTDKSMREIGEELGVRSILEGSVRRDRERVRIVAQLIDTETDTHLWAETYDRDLENVFELQSELAGKIAGALGRTLAPQSADAGAALSTADPETYDLYLRGRHLWNERRTDALHRAKDYFEQATRRDPEFAPAHAALADVHLVLPFYDPSVTVPDAIDLARPAVERALELAPELGEAHATLGFLHTLNWQWREAEAEFRRAIELNPGYATAHQWYGALLIGLVRPAESVAAYERAARLDPFAARTASDLGSSLTSQGRTAEALSHLQRARELNPAMADNHLRFWALYTELGRDSAAAEAVLAWHRTAGIVDPSAETLRSVMAAEGLEGVLGALVAVPDDRLGGAFYKAEFAARLGDFEETLRSLERAIDRREAYAPFIAGFAEFRPLHGDPRFHRLLERMGLDADEVLRRWPVAGS